MEAASHILARILRFCVWFIKKYGINGLLIIVLVVELPLVSIFCDGLRTDYVGKRNYQIQKVNAKPLDEEALRACYPALEMDEDTYYFLVTAYLTNFYSNEMRYSLLHATNQDGDSLNLYNIEYYNEEVMNQYSISMSNLIPAGATKPCNYVLEVSRYEYENTRDVILSETIEETEITAVFSLPR